MRNAGESPRGTGSGTMAAVVAVVAVVGGGGGGKGWPRPRRGS